MRETGCSRDGCRYLPKGTYCISSVRMFQDLPADIQKELVSHSVHSSWKAGSRIVSENDEIRSVIIIRSGKVKISITDIMGVEHILDVLHDGQSVWHGIFLKEHRYNYDVVCIDDVEICEIPRSVIMQVLSQHPQAALNLIEVLAEDITDAEDKIMVLSIRDPKQRIAAFLLKRESRCLGDEIHLKLEDIASSVNLRIETVSRYIAQMEKEGMVSRIGRGRLKIIKHGKLKSILNQEQ
ncbi:MAG: Crp/Fnr family transcriptional regulator [Bilifractor sp.]